MCQSLQKTKLENYQVVMCKQSTYKSSSIKHNFSNKALTKVVLLSTISPKEIQHKAAQNNWS